MKLVIVPRKGTSSSSGNASVEVLVLDEAAIGASSTLEENSWLREHIDSWKMGYLPESEEKQGGAFSLPGHYHNHYHYHN